MPRPKKGEPGVVILSITGDKGDVAALCDQLESLLLTDAEYDYEERHVGGPTNEHVYAVKQLPPRYPLTVQCARDDTTWNCHVNEVKGPDGIIRQRYINCPTCFRGYQWERGKWMSDRELIIIEYRGGE